MVAFSGDPSAAATQHGRVIKQITVSASESPRPTTDNFSALFCSGPFRHTLSDLKERAIEMGETVIKKEEFFSVTGDNVLRNPSAGVV